VNAGRLLTLIWNVTRLDEVAETVIDVMSGALGSSFTESVNVAGVGAGGGEGGGIVDSNR
jgi:hypothetical protein